MESGLMSESIAVLVCSCDKYTEAWEPMFGLMNIYWQDCKYKKTLLTNEKEFNKFDVISLKSGSIADWSTSFINALEMIDEEYVLVLMEDYFLQKKVRNDDFDAIEAYMSANPEVACMRIHPSPAPPGTGDKTRIGHMIFEEISNDDEYSINLQAGVWKKDFLLEIAEKNESAWQFEHHGSQRMQERKEKILVISDKENIPFDYYCTGIIQGYWIKEAVELCRKHGITVRQDTIELEPIHIRLRRIIRDQYLSKPRKFLRKSAVYSIYHHIKYSQKE